MTKANKELVKEAKQKRANKRAKSETKIKKNTPTKKYPHIYIKIPTLCTQRGGPEFFSSTHVHVAITKKGQVPSSLAQDLLLVQEEGKMRTDQLGRFWT